MIPLKLWPLMVCVVVIFSGRALGRDSKDPMALAFRTLKGEQEKTEFLTYFLALGLQDWASRQPRPPKFLIFNRSDTFTKNLNIPRESVEKFENMNIPVESRRKLLEWTKGEFNLSTKDVLELVKGKKTSGRIRFPDIGELCCPW